MGWDGSGNFTRDNGTNSGATTWADDASAGIKIRADSHDSHDEDLADGIEACLTKNGESKATANFLPNVTDSYDVGSSSLKWGEGHFSGDVHAKNTQVLLSSQTISSTPADIRFTELDTTYDEYILIFDNVASSGSTNSELEIQFGTGGSSPTWLAAASHFFQSFEINNAATARRSGNGTFGLEISPRSGIGTAGFPHLNGEAKFRNIGVSSGIASCEYNNYYFGSTSSRCQTYGSGFATVTGTYTAIRVIHESTTLASGQLHLYGRNFG